MQSRLTHLFSLVATGIVAVAACAAEAQPVTPHSPATAADAGGVAIEQVIGSLRHQLGFSPSQQVLWDTIAVQAKTNRAAARAGIEQVHAALTAELAKPEPDFAAVAVLSDEAQASAQADRKRLRDRWLALYATFTPAQKALVRDTLRARLARLESFRARMKERFDGGAARN